jgi:hypothetical protein
MRKRCGNLKVSLGEIGVELIESWSNMLAFKKELSLSRTSDQFLVLVKNGAIQKSKNPEMKRTRKE